MHPFLTSHSFRMALFYAASFLFIGVFMPYFPSWLEARGLSVVEIGLITGLPFFIRMPIIFVLGVSADAIGDRRRLVVLLMVVSLSAVSLLPFAHQFWAVFAAVALMSTAFGAIVPLSDAIALSGPKQTRDNYGRVRLWGSIAFIVGNVACGVAITAYGTSMILVWAISALFLTLAFAFYLPATPRTKQKFVPALNGHLREAGRLIRVPVFLYVILAYGLIQSSHSIFYVFSVIHWRGLGMSATTTGGLWAVGVVAEVILFIYSALLNIWSEQGPIIIRIAHSRRTFVTSLGLGSVLPVLRSATGRVFLAHLPGAVTDDMVAQEREILRHQPLLSQEGYSKADLKKIITSVKTTGLAAVDGYVIRGLRAIAGPILNIQGEAAAVVTLIDSNPDLPHLDSEIGQKLKAFCEGLSV